MNDDFECEIKIDKSSFKFEKFLNRTFIPEELKEEKREANVFFIPRIINDEPFFEIPTQDLFYFMKKNENENFKVNICIEEEDFKFIRSEAEQIFIMLGWFFIEKLALGPFIEKIKNFFKERKEKDKELVELKIFIKEDNQEKTTEIHYKGPINGLNKILKKIDAK